MEYYSLDGGLSKVKSVNRFISKVYLTMVGALFLSAGASFYILRNPALFEGMMTGGFFKLLLFVEILLVIAIGFLLPRINVFFAGLLFIIYSLLNGITLSVIFYAYEPAAILNAFLITAGTFLFMSYYGYTTESDLTSFGKIMIMGLFGIILAMIVNFFLGSATVSYVISCVAVVVFTGLVAYDTQKLKVIGEMVADDPQESKKYILMGALELYLDFINLFINLLYLLGGRK